MKKTLFLLPVITALVACNTQQNPHLRKVDLKILSPQGAPAVAMYNFVNGLTTVINPATGVLPEFGQDNYDIIVAPAKGGLNKIVNAHANYQMAAVVTSGNFGLVSTGNDEDGTLNAGDKVLYFQPADIPGAIFNYLYGDLGLVTYSVDDVKLTAGALGTGSVTIGSETIKLDYVFSAEPLISNKNKSSDIKEWASDAFYEKTQGKNIIQAAVFVNKNTSTKKVDEFLTLLQKDMEDAVSNPKNIVKTFNLFGDVDEQENKFGVSANAVYNAMKNYNGLGLGYLKAKDAQDEIDYFINDILKINLQLDEEVYY